MGRQFKGFTLRSERDEKKTWPHKIYNSEPNPTWTWHGCGARNNFVDSAFDGMFAAPAPAVPYYDEPAVAAVPYYDEPAAVVEVASPAGRIVDSHRDGINLGSDHL